MKPERHKTMTKKQQKMSQICEFLKKSTQLALSFSVFSFILFLHPTWFTHILNAIISKNPSQILSVVTDKNYIFLLCNGILVFIAKYSSTSSKVETQPQPDHQMTSPENELIFRNYPQTLHPSMVFEKLVLEEYVTVAIADEEEEEEENGHFLVTDERQKEEEEEEEVDQDQDQVFGDDGQENFTEEYENEEEEEEDEGIAEMSTEELNRKFEDFIRKMKEELRIEAQQQLIMV